MEYSFDVELAKKYGVNEAIIIKNLIFWINKNKANNKHEHEGRTWTYNSMEAWHKLFPFWSVHQIRRILESLIKQQVIITGNYNKITYDRTTWYSLENLSIWQNRKMDLAESQNGFGETGRPIPDIKPDIKPDIITPSQTTEKSWTVRIKDWFYKQSKDSKNSSYNLLQTPEDWAREMKYVIKFKKQIEARNVDEKSQTEFALAILGIFMEICEGTIPRFAYRKDNIQLMPRCLMAEKTWPFIIEEYEKRRKS